MKTTTVIRDLPALFISGLLFFLWPSRGVQAQSQTPSKGTYARQIADTALSGQPLRAVGDVVPDEAEAKALADALGTEPHKTTLEAAPDLEFFVQNHPNSPYTPSVRASLAKSYAENGRYTPALQHWEASWDATKNLTGNGKEVADFALAHYTRLLANLGRTDRLSVIYQETQGRMLDYGPLQVLYDATFEAVNAASSTPDLTMGCGGYALAQVANALNVSPENRRRIVRAPMPPRGYSLKDLTDLAAQARA